MAPPTIKTIAPIKNLGVFKDRRTADSPQFLQYNLIYGFNGSGKTTFARILASLELGSLRPELPEGGTFEVHLSDGTSLKSSGELTALRGRVLVFNVDFIEQSFKWKDGTARPVFYIGRAQAAAAENLEATLASLKKLSEKHNAAELTKSSKERTFAQFKRDSARLIAEQLSLGRRYDASSLSADYAERSYGDELLLTDAEINSSRSTIAQQSPLPKLTTVKEFDLSAADLAETTRRLVGTTLGAIVAKDLQGHELMSQWVADGLRYHENHALENCLFCGNRFSHDRRILLRQSVDSQFESFRSEIDSSMRRARMTQNTCRLIAMDLPSDNDVFESERTEFSRIRASLINSFAKVEGVGETAESILSDKKSLLHTAVDASAIPTRQECADIDSQIRRDIGKLNLIISRHNTAFDEFDKARSDASARLKEHYLADSASRYSECKAEVDSAQSELRKLSSEKLDLESKEIELRSELQQHGPAAQTINKLIHNYLGRREIELVAHDEGYQLKREGRVVRGSLSEGEKTAISLCYFLCTLEAEGRQRSDLIVVLDDPVSSLDSRALNYAFSIVKATVGSAGQVFLLTHNINFMNEAKKWLKPQTEKEAAKRGKQATSTLLFLNSIQSGGIETRVTGLVELPKYIREYESEYHYLFHLVLQFVEAPKEYSGYFYLMPNAIRRILDVFLAFKLPGSDGFGSKIEAMVKLEHGLDPARIRALDRLVQLESHSDNLDDLITFSAMSVEETTLAAETVLQLMENLDKDHFWRIKSICSD